MSTFRNMINLIEGTAGLSARPITSAPEFQRWFSGSEVVDAEGQPLIVYHGTSKDTDFKAFKIAGNGVWFTTDADSASDYAEQNDSQTHVWDGGNGYVRKHTASRVIPVYLRMVNPVRWSKWPDQIRLATNYKRAQSALFQHLRSEGHDGIIFDDSVYVVLGTPDQIKSALGNKSFGSSKNIHEQTATEQLESDASLRRWLSGYNEADRDALALTEQPEVEQLPPPQPGLTRCTVISCNAILDHFRKPVITKAEIPKNAVEAVNLFERRGLKVHFPSAAEREHTSTIKQFALSHQKGCWYIGSQGHAMAMVDDALFDTMKQGFDSRKVLLFLEVSG